MKDRSWNPVTLFHCLVWLGIQSVNQTFDEELDFDPAELDIIYQDLDEEG